MILSRLINEAWNRESFDSARHQAVLDEIDRVGTASLSLFEAAEAFKYLRNIVCYKAEIDRGPPPESDSRDENASLSDPPVDESRYPEEMKRLHALQDCFRISSALQEWVSTRRRKLVRELQEDGFAYRASYWDTLAPDERKALLRELAAKQMAVFESGEFAFQMPEITFVKEFPDDSASRMIRGTASIDG